MLRQLQRGILTANMHTYNRCDAENENCIPASLFRHECRRLCLIDDAKLSAILHAFQIISGQFHDLTF